MSTNFFLGFRMEVHPQWRERVGTPKAPGNYTKTESIQKYIDKKWEEMEANPFSFPLASTVKRVAVMGLNGKDPEILKPEEFVAKARAILPTLRPVRMFGFDIHERMIQLMLSVFDRRGDKGFPHWMLHSYHDGEEQVSNLIDPWKPNETGPLPREQFLQFAPIDSAAKTAYAPGDTDALAVEAAKLSRAVAEMLNYV